MSVENRKIAHNELRVTIIGSFRFKAEIDNTRTAFEENGTKVLAPPTGNISDKLDGFKIIERQVETPRQSEFGFLMAMSRSDLLYIVNPNGYLGQSGMLEVIYNTFFLGKPMFSSEPTDPTLKHIDFGNYNIWENITKRITPWPKTEIPSLISALNEYRMARGKLPSKPLVARHNSEMGPNKIAGLIIDSERMKSWGEES